MKRKKPDRIERIVRKEYEKWINGPQEKGWLSIADKLLRREHAWMRRMVRKVWDWQAEQLADTDDVCSVILHQLAKRRK